MSCSSWPRTFIIVVIASVYSPSVPDPRIHQQSDRALPASHCSGRSFPWGGRQQRGTLAVESSARGAGAIALERGTAATRDATTTSTTVAGEGAATTDAFTIFGLPGLILRSAHVAPTCTPDAPHLSLSSNARSLRCAIFSDLSRLSRVLRRQLADMSIVGHAAKPNAGGIRGATGPFWRGDEAVRFGVQTARVKISWLLPHTRLLQSPQEGPLLTSVTRELVAKPKASSVDANVHSSSSSTQKFATAPTAVSRIEATMTL